MSELGIDARGLVLAGRGSLGPSAADRERIARALRERLGDGLSATAATNTASTGLAWKGFALLGSVLAVGATVAALSFSHGDAPASSAVVPPAPARAVSDNLPVDVEPAHGAAASAPSVTRTEALPLEPRAAAPQHRSSRLAEEVSILSRAETELHAGRPASALELLDEHRRKFPRGALVQERIAARVQALCALGRTSEAESELARLKRVSPDSPQEARAREACAPGAKG
jgi:hypothetical protein